MEGGEQLPHHDLRVAVAEAAVLLHNLSVEELEAPALLGQGQEVGFRGGGRELRRRGGHDRLLQPTTKRGATLARGPDGPPAAPHPRIGASIATNRSGRTTP